MGLSFQAKMYGPATSMTRLANSWPSIDRSWLFGAAKATPNDWRRLVVELLFQLFKLVLEPRILRDFALDLANGVQHRRMIAAAEASTDLR